MSPDAHDSTPLAPVHEPAVDPRLAHVEWRDLIRLRPWQTSFELLFPLPWLFASLVAVDAGHVLMALPMSFCFFLAGLRLVHDAYHHNLGLPGRWTDAVMCVMSPLMLASMHAIQHNHLQHHRHCMSEHDVEARSAHMRWWAAIAWGPVFPVLLHVTALRDASPRRRRWVHVELLLLAVLVLAAAVAGPGALAYHVVAMVVGNSLTAFFAVWTVHHDCEERPRFARTMRNRVKSILAFDMFFHVEHHLFPKVPTRHLPELSRRLDVVAPEYGELQVY